MKYNINFYLRHGVRGSAIRAVVNYNGKSVERSLSVPPVAPEYWDNKRQRVRHGSSSAVDINTAITAAEDRVSALFTQCGKELRIASTKEVGDALSGLRSQSSNADTMTLYTSYIKEQSVVNGWTQRYLGNIISLGRILRQSGVLDCQVTDIDGHHMKDFVRHLVGRGVSNNTVRNYLTHLRTFLRWCEQNGNSVPPSAFSVDIRLKVPRSEPLFLTPDEIHRIATLDLEEGTFPSLVRDIFLLQCYTGLRFSDAVDLRWSDITPSYIRVTTRKTVDELTIDLNDHARGVLDRYRHLEGVTERVFPRVGLTAFDTHLHHIGQMAHIEAPVTVVTTSGGIRTEHVVPKWQRLSSHVGRKTFISLALSAGVPHAVIVKWTGHRNMDAFMRYANTTTDAREQGMQHLENILP